MPAGELVTVTVAAGETDKGYTIQVSGHKDSICGKRDEYMRICTSPARTFALDSPTVELRTAFGGALYIDVGDDPPASAYVLPPGVCRPPQCQLPHHLTTSPFPYVYVRVRAFCQF